MKDMTGDDLALLRAGQREWIEETRLQVQRALRRLEAAGLVKTQLRPIQPNSNGTVGGDQFLWKLTPDGLSAIGK